MDFLILKSYPQNSPPTSSGSERVPCHLFSTLPLQHRAAYPQSTARVWTWGHRPPRGENLCTERKVLTQEAKRAEGNSADTDLQVKGKERRSLFAPRPDPVRFPVYRCNTYKYVKPSLSVPWKTNTQDSRERILTDEHGESP